MDKILLQNKTAFVTGADKGIGLATAKLLKDRGAKVITCTRREEEKSKLINMGFDVFYLDVCRIEESLKYLKEISKYVNILVNNAGIAPCNLFPKTSKDIWNNVIQTNLESVYQLSQIFLPQMRRKKWGRIINVSSVLATYPQKGFSAYSASKSGLEGLTKTLALEYANKQITINAVAPGFTDTDILKVLGELGDEMSKNIPIGFMAQPEDIAECIAFLASDSARYITGEVINISGGLKF